MSTQNGHAGVAPIALRSDDAEITSFTSKIGSELMISNEKDKEIVSHLIDYIDALMQDKSNLFALTSDLTTNNDKLKVQLQEMRQENAKLEQKHQLQMKVMEEQKSDFADAIIRTSTFGTEDEQSAQVLEKILGEEDLNKVKDGVQDQRLQSYKEAISTHDQELKDLESQISDAKFELSSYKQELADRASLERELEKVKDELIDAQDLTSLQLESKKKEIEGQKALISEQIQIMQTMESDIEHLENVVHEMNDKLHKENQSKEELLAQLEMQENDMHKAKKRRNQSMHDFVWKFSNHQTLRNVVPSQANLTGLAGMPPLSEMMLKDSSGTSDFGRPDMPQMGYGAAGIRSIDVQEWPAQNSLIAMGSESIDMAAAATLQEDDEPLHKQVKELTLELKQEKERNEKNMKQMEDEANKLRDEVDELNEQIYELKNGEKPEMYMTEGADDTTELLKDRKGANTNDKQQTTCVMFGLKVW